MVGALNGRRARNIYVTDEALAHPNFGRLLPRLEVIALFSGGEIRHVREYEAMLQGEHEEVAA